MTLDPRLASRAQNMRPNAIRRLFKLMARPGMISLAGGVPAAETLPVAQMNGLVSTVMDKHGAAALQYGATEGLRALREALVPYLQRQSISVSADDILVCSGSQSVLDLVAKMLVSPGDIIAIEEPTYVGALSAFASYEPQIVSIKSDEDGIIPASLDQVLKAQKVKFVYLSPTFQNPTGRTLPLERRQAIGRILKEHDCPLVEDDPYSALRYSGEAVPPIWGFAPEQVIYTSSFSKIFAPGLRTGFCVAPKWLHPSLVVAKQGTDLHTSTLCQALAAEYLTGGHYEAQIELILSTYERRLHALLGGLERYMPEGFTWSKPDGGMFVWLEGPPGVDAEAICEDAIAHGAAFLPGKYFYSDIVNGQATMRLSFTSATEEKLEIAARTIAQSIERVGLAAGAR